MGGETTIVGIVSDVRDTPADVTAIPAFWMPLGQQPFREVRGAVLTEGDPVRFVPALRAAFAELDRELPVAEVRTLDQIATAALAERRFALWLCESFAVLSLILAAAGVYAMLSYSVQQRRREYGIRIALGATSGDVSRVCSPLVWPSRLRDGGRAYAGSCCRARAFCLAVRRNCRGRPGAGECRLADAGYRRVGLCGARMVRRPFRASVSIARAVSEGGRHSVTPGFSVPFARATSSSVG